jgi:hypothetical protein
MPPQEVVGISAEEFWERYAKRGAVGLVGGTSWIHKAICDAQTLITPDNKPSLWAHAFVFLGRRADGYDWLAESDIVVHLAWRPIVNGAQESRIDKYYGTKKALHCAILDFGLSDQDGEKVVSKALEMVTKKIMYPVSGLLGTFFAYLFHAERSRNLLNTPNALYCSAFVQEAYLAAGIDLAPGVETTNTAPEHIWLTKVAHQTYVLKRI